MLLKELSQAFGVSGEEGAVRQIIREAISAHVQDLAVDSIGNLTAQVPAKGRGKQPLRVMIAAHMDEVGFMVMGIEKEGTLRFASVGGVDERLLPGMRVRVGRKQIPGFVQWTPIHMNREQDVTAIKNLRIDIGAGTKSAAEGKVQPGDRVSFDSEYMELSETMLRGKAFDDRVGCSLLVDLLQSGPYPVEVLPAFTVQEEVGLRGARVAAQRLKPDLAIVLEGTTAHDVPDPGADPDDVTTPNPACKVGAGPVLTVMDRSMITAPHLLRWARQTAEAEGIPYQLKTALGGGTDAGAIHLTNAGVPSLVISMPCRYIHSPQALLSRTDYENTLRLLQTLLRKLKPEHIRHD